MLKQIFVHNYNVESIVRLKLVVSVSSGFGSVCGEDPVAMLSGQVERVTF